MRECYWTDADRISVNAAETFEDMLKTAMAVIGKIPRPTGMVCGPIANGGLGSISANLAVFQKAIDGLTDQGLNIFSQMPCEYCVRKIKNTPRWQGALHLLTAFYLPIFESGKISAFYFIPGWQTSEGARWEHGQATRLEIKISYL